MGNFRIQKLKTRNKLYDMIHTHSVVQNRLSSTIIIIIVYEFETIICFFHYRVYYYYYNFEMFVL